jgi:hypothetical protein
VRAPGIAPGTADWQTATLLLRHARTCKLGPCRTWAAGWLHTDPIGQSGLRPRIENRRFLKENGRPDGWSAAERRTGSGARPRAKRVNRTGTGNDAQRGLSPPCLVPTTPRRNGADRGNRTLMSFRPSAPRADVSTIPRHPHEKMEHPQGRAPCCLSYQDSPSLSTDGMQSGRSGRIGSRS